jgi:hypothetical protein
VNPHVKKIPRKMPSRDATEKRLRADPPRTQPTVRLAHDRITCERLVV